MEKVKTKLEELKEIEEDLKRAVDIVMGASDYIDEATIKLSNLKIRLQLFRIVQEHQPTKE